MKKIIFIAIMATLIFTGCGTIQSESQSVPETSFNEEDASSSESNIESNNATEIVETEEVAEIVETEEVETEATEIIETETCIEESYSEEVVFETEEYSFTELSVIKYAKSSVNVRNTPNTTGEKVGALNTNQEVSVTGQCNETGWYRITYNNDVAYVSNNYLIDEKTEIKNSQTSTESTASSWNYHKGGNPLIFQYAETIYGKKEVFTQENINGGDTRTNLMATWSNGVETLTVPSFLYPSEDYPMRIDGYKIVTSVYEGYSFIDYYYIEVTKEDSNGVIEGNIYVMYDSQDFRSPRTLTEQMRWDESFTNDNWIFY